ncbi:MAG TPA: molybdopterin-binding protein [Anaerolineae bacterium]
MQLKNILVEQSVGAILIHNVMGPDGRKAFSKGSVVRAEDVEKLRALGQETVYAAVLDPDDVREDDAAVRLARAAAGRGIELSKPSGGRVNLYAAEPGFLQINRDALKRMNELNGVTLATIARYASVPSRKIIATLKTVGLALPEATLREAEKIVGARGKAVSIAPVSKRQVANILTGSANGKAKVQGAFGPPIRARIQELGAQVLTEDYVSEDEAEIAGAIDRAARAGAQLIVLAGETSVMDADDRTPRGIKRAGGEIELYGAPVEPGNLLLLAYKPYPDTANASPPGRREIPILGAPGCVKSRETNVVDLILPRLLIGEHVTRSDVIELAEGGLLV